jgi:hypothetical protein
MKRDGLNKLYDRLAPEERFRLVVEALSRGDDEEAERLADSCPRKGYIMNELAFQDRLRTISQITMVMFLDIFPLLAQLQVIDALRATLPRLLIAYLKEIVFAYVVGHNTGSKRAWKAAGKTGDPPGWKQGEIDPATAEVDLGAISARLEEATQVFMGHLDNVEHHIAREARTIWKAFGSFCSEELGLEPEKLVKALFESAPEWLEKLEGTLEPLETDPDGLEEYRDAMKRTWSELIREL